MADADEADAAFLGGAFAAVAVVEFCAILIFSLGLYSAAAAEIDELVA